MKSIYPIISVLQIPYKEILISIKDKGSRYKKHFHIRQKNQNQPAYKVKKSFKWQMYDNMNYEDLSNTLCPNLHKFK